MDQQQRPSKQTGGEKPLKGLGIDLEKWTVGERRLALFLVGAGLAVLITGISAYVFPPLEWTGLTTAEQRWLKVLAPPLILATGAGILVPWLNWQQKKRELRTERQQEQSAALQAYLDKMSELLIDKQIHTVSNAYDAIRVTARARTLVLLEQLEGEDDDGEAGERKGTVLLFLREARLINRVRIAHRRGCVIVIYHAHYVGLKDANLRKAKLRGRRLISTSGKEPVSLEGAIFAGADFSDAILEGANLRDTNLSDANLEGANVVRANLVRANLVRANLKGANLKGANLRQANFLRTSLGKAELGGAKLRGARNLTKRQLAKAYGDETTELPEAWECPPTWK